MSGLRILNILEAREPAPPRFSTTPCAGCDSRCCSMQATVSSVEALLIAGHLQKPLLDFVEVVPWYASRGLDLAWPFKLDRERATFAFRRPHGHCVNLREGGGCGVYEVRPANCRLFPFDLQDDEGRIHVGHPGNCPTQWMQNDATRDEAARDLARYRRMRAQEMQVVHFWNRGTRERTREAYIDWLTTTVGPQL